MKSTLVCIVLNILPFLVKAQLDTAYQDQLRDGFASESGYFNFGLSDSSSYMRVYWMGLLSFQYANHDNSVAIYLDDGNLCDMIIQSVETGVCHLGFNSYYPDISPTFLAKRGSYYINYQQQQKGESYPGFSVSTRSDGYTNLDYSAAHFRLGGIRVVEVNEQEKGFTALYYYRRNGMLKEYFIFDRNLTLTPKIGKVNLENPRVYHRYDRKGKLKIPNQ